MRVLIVLSVLLASCSVNEKPKDITWNDWNADLLERAKKENKLVLLDVKANWCHWCHVMDDSTYSNGEVIKYLNDHFIVAQADHDARPDMAARYRKWGWPATIVFNSSGQEILKKAGFMNPGEFLEVLKNCVENPEALKASNPRINNKKQSEDYFAGELLPKMKKKCVRVLDIESGGHNTPMKYIDWNSFEYAINQNNPRLNTWLKNTVRNARGLVDKEWGGVYQYSTYNDWKHPHYEKLLRNQSRYINVYVWYAKAFNDTAMLAVAEKIADYCFSFLWNEGKGFYNSQNADLIPGEKAAWYFALRDDERRKKGIPSIDKHIYTSTNGMMIKSLVILWGATGNQKYLDAATQTAEYLIKNRRSENGGYQHDNVKDNIWTLADNLPMAEALVMVYRATADKRYLDEAVKTAEFIHSTFLLPEGSYASDVADNGLEPNVVYNENIDLCRFFNLLSHTANKPEIKKNAQSLFSRLTTPGIVEELIAEPGMVMAYDELRNEPMSGTFLEITPSPQTKNIRRELVSAPRSYFTNHTYTQTTLPDDKKEMFGSFTSNILFFCTSQYCSSPMYSVKDVREFLTKK